MLEKIVDHLSLIVNSVIDLEDVYDESSLLTAKAFGFCMQLRIILLPLIYIAVLILQIVTNGFGIKPFIGALLASGVLAIVLTVLMAALVYVETLAKHVASLLMYGQPKPREPYTDLETFADIPFAPDLLSVLATASEND